ncbi:MAG: hypothetical protein F4X78_04620 [Gammaproteobacteria bacterium]|nr:hypothetical protein [Gammaproteobacteria bacterium]
MGIYGQKPTKEIEMAMTHTEIEEVLATGGKLVGDDGFHNWDVKPFWIIPFGDAKPPFNHDNPATWPLNKIAELESWRIDRGNELIYPFGGPNQITISLIDAYGNKVASASAEL